MLPTVLNRSIQHNPFNYLAVYVLHFDVILTDNFCLDNLHNF